jgi:Na+/melibiose symporter-like transporter
MTTTDVPAHAVPAAAASDKAAVRIPRGQLLAYAAPALGLYAIGLPVAVQLPAYYAKDLGLGLTLVGQIFMLCRFFDLAADLALGAASDRVRSRWGRRRPMLALAVPLMCLGAFQMFAPPEAVGPIYVLGWLIVMYAGYALGVISHISWGAELSPDYHQRSRIQGWREMAGIAGMLAVLAVPAVLESIGGGTRADHIAAMGWFIVAIFPLGVLFAITRVPDPPFVGTGAPHLTLRAALGTIARNRLVRRVLLVDLLVGVPPAITGALYIFMVEFIVEAPELSSRLLLGYFVAGIVGIPAWLALSYRIGKHRAFTLGALWHCVSSLLFLTLGPGDVAGLAALTILNGFSYGSGTFLLRAVMADVADTDELETGHSRTGLFYGLLAMTNKVGYALAVGVAYPVLALFGFSPSHDIAAGDGPVPGVDALLAIFVFVPLVMNLAAAAVMVRFPLDANRLAAVHRALAERRAQA